MIKLIRSLKSSLYLGLLALTLTIAIPVIAQPPTVINQAIEQPNKPNSLNPIDRGRVAYEEGRYTEAVIAWQQAERTYKQQGDRLNQASTLNYLSLAHQKLGEWQEAEKSNAQSLKLLQEQSKQNNENLALLAQALNTKGSL